MLALEKSVEECAHLSACIAALNFSPVHDVLVELSNAFPDVPSEVLIEHLRLSFKRLLRAGAIEQFVTESGETQDLSESEALAELDNSACWTINGRYLASAKASGTTYFEHIHENVKSYALQRRA